MIRLLAVFGLNDDAFGLHSILGIMPFLITNATVLPPYSRPGLNRSRGDSRLRTSRIYIYIYIYIYTHADTGWVSSLGEGDLYTIV